MTDTLTPRQPRGQRTSDRPEQRPSPRPSRDRHRAGRRPLGSYADEHGRPRQILARPGAAGSVLVIDCDARTLADRRLVAHLAADEPTSNAALVCREYLENPGGRWCRPVRAEDLRQGPFDGAHPSACADTELHDGEGRRYELGAFPGRTVIPELRWSRRPAPGRPAVAVSLREVVGALESYEPARELTVQAIARHAQDEGLSEARLRNELQRLDASRIVLNRGLREAVLAATRAGGLSLSEIALRCGRFKRDGRGGRSGETSWLTRRIGLAPLGGASAPTPWIHSEVLALIARRGLDLGPREVELG